MVDGGGALKRLKAVAKYILFELKNYYKLKRGGYFAPSF
jgi:hypothetical protein